MRVLATIKLKAMIDDEGRHRLDIKLDGESDNLLSMCTSAIADILQDIVEPDEIEDATEALAMDIIDKYQHETREV